MEISTTDIVRSAGVGQLLVALGSLAIPALLGWREKTARLDPLTRAVFWTYAGYVFATHVAFGLVSTVAAEWLLDGSALARSVCGFIALYWGARIAIQFLSFGRHRPSGRLFLIAEWGLVICFGYFTAVYAFAALAAR